MKNVLKKAAAAMAAAVLAAGLLAGCGGGGSASPGGSDSGSGVAITIFNSKMEIQDKLEEMAAKYSEEKGVDVEAYYSSDTVAAIWLRDIPLMNPTPFPWWMRRMSMPWQQSMRWI